MGVSLDKASVSQKLLSSLQLSTLLLRSHTACLFVLHAKTSACSAPWHECRYIHITHCPPPHVLHAQIPSGRPASLHSRIHVHETRGHLKTCTCLCLSCLRRSQAAAPASGGYGEWWKRWASLGFARIGMVASLKWAFQGLVQRREGSR